MKLKRCLIFNLISIISILVLIKLFSNNEKIRLNVFKNDKYLDYSKETVDWSKYPIIEEGLKNLILVLGEARSGTSFLADLIHQSWPTFYAFEPLFLMKKQNIRDNQTNAQKAIRILSKVFNCEFEDLVNHAICLWKNERNLVMQKYPGMNKSLIWNKSINRFVCDRCDNLLIKSIRISVKQFIQLKQKLKNPIKLVFIVRDPRGAMSSRFAPILTWCGNDSNCYEIDKFCQRTKEDLNELVKLNKKLPEMVSLIRFEDLSLQTIESAKGLFKKLGIEFNSAIEDWIKTHTNVPNTLGDPYSTSRKSKSVVFSWTNRLNSSQIISIQQKCAEVMDLLGYNLINFKLLTQFLNKSNSVKVEDILRTKFNLDYLTPKFE